MTPDNVASVPSKGTTRRSIRVPDEEWDPFVSKAASEDTDASAKIREFIRDDIDHADEFDGAMAADAVALNELASLIQQNMRHYVLLTDRFNTARAIRAAGWVSAAEADEFSPMRVAYDLTRQREQALEVIERGLGSDDRNAARDALCDLDTLLAGR